MDLDAVTGRWRAVTLLGAVAVALGSVPRWFTVERDPDYAAAVGQPEVEAVGGIAGDGLFTLVFAVVAILAVLVRSTRPDEIPRVRAAVAAAIAGLAAAVISGWSYYAWWTDQQDVDGGVAAGLESAEPHLALYAVLLGAAVVMFGGGLGIGHDADQE